MYFLSYVSLIIAYCTFEWGRNVEKEVNNWLEYCTFSIIMLVVYEAATHIVFGRKTEFVRNNGIEIFLKFFAYVLD